jgi:hypothetical protein
MRGLYSRKPLLFEPLLCLIQALGKVAVGREFRPLWQACDALVVEFARAVLKLVQGRERIEGLLCRWRRQWRCWW